MEKITTKQQLVVLLKNMISIEQLARNRYFDESVQFKSRKIVSTLSKIKKQEDEHIAILENLIEKLEKDTTEL